MPVRRWRWRITFTVRYNRISGEECLADKCHDNDRLGIGGRITSFHHPTPDYADRPILRERGGEERRLSVCLLIFLDKWFRRTTTLSLSFPLFFASPFTSLPPRPAHVTAHVLIPIPVPVSILARSFPFLSFILSSTIRSSNSTWRERERKRDVSLWHTCPSYELVATNVTRRHLCT